MINTNLIFIASLDSSNKNKNNNPQKDQTIEAVTRHRKNKHDRLI